MRADCFPLTPELFAQLDKNKDGRIGRDEFPTLDTVPPHVVIAAEFGKRNDEESSDGNSAAESDDTKSRPNPRQARLKLVHVAAGLTSVPRDNPEPSVKR